MTFKYRYVDAIAATVPDGRLSAVRRRLGDAAIRKDLAMTVPTLAPAGYGTPAAAEANTAGVETIGAADAQTGGAIPADYAINSTLMNLGPASAASSYGSGVKVALIDSGIRPQFPHITGSVLGGEARTPSATGSDTATSTTAATAPSWPAWSRRT